VDVAEEAEDMAAEEKVINTRGAPTRGAKKTTHAKWTKLPQTTVKRQRPPMRLYLIKVTTLTLVTEPHKVAAEGQELLLAEVPTGVDNDKK
jgi:hypothetical protein